MSKQSQEYLDGFERGKAVGIAEERDRILRELGVMDAISKAIALHEEQYHDQE